MQLSGVTDGACDWRPGTLRCGRSDRSRWLFPMVAVDLIELHV